MAMYSKVTNGKYVQLHKSDKKGYVSELSGWYVGGVVSTGNYGKQLTVHIMQPDGEIVGVNTSPGFFKQWKKFNDPRNVLVNSLGKFVTLKTGKPIPTPKGSFIPVDVVLSEAPTERPHIDFEIIPAIDLDKLQVNSKVEAQSNDDGIFSVPVAGNVSVEGNEVADFDEVF